MSGFVFQALCFGMLTTFGIFFNPMLDEFHWSRATLSVASSLAFLLFGFFGIIAGRLSDRINPRWIMITFGSLLGVGYLLMAQMHNATQLYVFYGLLVGIGLASADVLPLSTVARWFIAKRGTITGFVKLGSGVGMLVMPLLAFDLISRYDWRQAYVILGIVVLVITIVLAQFMIREPSQKGLLPLGGTPRNNREPAEEEPALSLKQMLRTRKFALAAAIYGLTLFASRTLQIHIVPYAIDLGLSAADSAAVLATFGAVSMAGRFVMGLVVDKIGNTRSIIICASALLFSFILLQGANDLGPLLVFASVLGFSHGGFFTILSPLMANLFGMDAHGMNIGIMMFSGTIGGAIGPIMAGQMFDTSGSYQTPFLICTIASAAVLVLALALRRDLTQKPA